MSEGASDEILGVDAYETGCSGPWPVLGEKLGAIVECRGKMGCDVCFKGILVAAVLTQGCKETRAG